MARYFTITEIAITCWNKFGIQPVMWKATIGFTASEQVFQKGITPDDKPFSHFTDMLKVAPDMLQLQSFNSVGGFVTQYIHGIERCTALGC
jgi:hypothetical protein